MPISNHTEYVLGLTNNKFDPELGAKVEEALTKLGLVTPLRDNITKAHYNPELAVHHLIVGISNGLGALGFDMVNDPSLKDTPRRYAHMLVGELTKGLNFDFFPKCTTFPNGQRVEDKEAMAWLMTGLTPEQQRAGIQPVYKTVGATDEMVFLGQIQTLSLCEHHLQTIDGFTYIGYLPNEKQIGLSKLARVTDFFARRPQVQERMTEQIYAALAFILGTPDVAVIQRCAHYCMRARGSLQHASVMQTNKMGGRFMEKPALREEFLNACNF